MSLLKPLYMQKAIQNNPAVRLMAVYGMIAMLALAVLPSYHTHGCRFRPGPQRVYRVTHEHPECAACVFEALVKLAPGDEPPSLMVLERIAGNVFPFAGQLPTLGAPIVPCANSPPMA